MQKASFNKKRKYSDKGNSNDKTNKYARNTTTILTVEPCKDVLNFIDFVNEDKWYIQCEKYLFDEKTQIEKKFSNQWEALAYLKEEAKQRYANLCSYLERLQRKVNKDKKWFESIVEQGTIRDKISTRVLLIQESPMISLHHLQWLIDQIGQLNRSGSSSALDALKDLMIHDLLPKDRKLYSWSENPLYMTLQKQKLDQVTVEKKGLYQKLKKKLPNESKNHVFVTFTQVDLLKLWFEDQLKYLYSLFVLALEQTCRDTHSFLRQRSLKIVSELLVCSPEQEKALMVFLIHQLTNPKTKADGTSIIFFLNEVLKAHPVMTPVVIRYILKAFSELLVQNVFFQKDAVKFYNSIRFLINLSSFVKDKEICQAICDHLMKMLTFFLNHFKNALNKDDKRKRLSKKIKRRKKRERKNGKKKILPDKPSDLDVLPNYRLLRSILDGLNCFIPYVSESFLFQYSFDQKVFKTLLDHITTHTGKVSLFLFWTHFNNALSQDCQFLWVTLYQYLSTFQLIQASNSTALLKLFQSCDFVKDQHTTLLLSYYRRLLQMSLHVPCGFNQLELLKNVCDFLSNNFVWSSSVLFYTDEEILQENDDSYHDAPLADLKQPCIETEQCSNSSSKVGGYNPLQKNPFTCGCQETHLWEMNLLQCSVHPTVSKHVKELYSFLREWRQSKKSWSQIKAKPLSIFNKYVKSQVSKKGSDVKKKEKNAVSLFSASCILHLLAYCSPQKEDSTNQATPINSSSFWLSKKEVEPHEEFMHQYFTDPFVIFQQSQRRKRVACDKENSPSHSDDDMEDVLPEELPEDFLTGASEDEMDLLEDDGSDLYDADNDNGLSDEETNEDMASMNFSPIRTKSKKKFPGEHKKHALFADANTFSVE
ncbi:CCAAT/enhancer-binding protein zeta-like isoform X2 [Hylaeus volcanicus]|uniref:CCAAT/enhancer-binding protein zeta-like isoform X2 n=1 Tax=Hylaeus volcanicus TaxID=313075 RepID=UPI0023B85B2F|nr:CCAAT/enhancer-binding protein zeta-like isoform X2 [Hylaeus volcanicus]